MREQKKLFPDGIKECGTDSLRLTLVSQNIKSKLRNLIQLCKIINLLFLLLHLDQVIHFDVNECYRNRMFCNKVWQATRFVLMWAVEKNVQSYTSPTPINSTQHWILSRLADCVQTINNSLQNYDIYISTTEFKQFFRYEFCDIFLVFLLMKILQ